MTIYIGRNVSRQDFSAASAICRDHGVRARRMSESMQDRHPYSNCRHNYPSTCIPCAVFNAIGALGKIESLWN